MNNRSKIYKYIDQYPIRRDITDIVVHCSATKLGQKVDVSVIDGWHKQRGFNMQKESGLHCGYHFVILEDGTIEIGRRLNEVGAHVAGANSKSIGICYAGGIGDNGKGLDTRTDAQKESLLYLLTRLLVQFPESVIKGHRDYSPDLNGNGIIEPWEWMKECPCFDAMVEYKDI